MSSFVKTKNITVESSQRLAKTKPCNNFLKYGECNRKVCTFAHSLEELKDPVCIFDDTCLNGYNCRYKHSTESQEQYYTRCKIKLPDFTPSSLFIIDISEDDYFPKPEFKKIDLKDFYKKPRVKLTVPIALREQAMVLSITRGNIDIVFSDE
jgi:hypothetical protein